MSTGHGTKLFGKEVAENPDVGREHFKIIYPDGKYVLYTAVPSLALNKHGVLSMQQRDVLVLERGNIFDKQGAD